MPSLQFGMKFPIQSRGTVFAQYLLAQGGREDPHSNSYPAALPAMKFGKYFETTYWN